ncbi:MAG TPA: RNA methyltransferase [Thermomicrobiales bacterium]
MIESAANPLIKRIRALQERKGREQAGALFVEGIQPVWQAVDAGAAIEMLVIAPALLTSVAAREMVARQQTAGVPVAEISSTLYKRIATRENPSGLAAIVRIVSRGLPSLVVTPQSLFVALHEIGNPGNLGTILRTVDAVGGSGVIFVGDTTDPYHPNAVRASVGTLFRIPVVQVERIEDVLEWSRAHGVGVVTTSARATREYWEARYPSPLLMLFGNEGRGLPSEVIEQGDLAVRIPMHGGASSLNLAVAAGVLLYEALRQRQAGR